MQPDPPIQSQKIWYAVEDSTILTRVLVVQSVTFPDYGRYILYKPIDWPDNDLGPPSCSPEATFRRIYTPQDTETITCENLPNGNYSFKTSLPRPLPWYTALVVQWRNRISGLNKYW